MVRVLELLNELLEASDERGDLGKSVGDILSPRLRSLPGHFKKPVTSVTLLPVYITYCFYLFIFAFISYKKGYRNIGPLHLTD